MPGGFAVFNNKLYILGGFQINTAMTNTIWEFNPSTNTWIQKAATLPVARGYIPTVTYFDFIYTAGGSDWNGTTLVDTNDSFKYDPIADSITSIPNIPRNTAETRALKFADGFVAGCAPSIWVMGGGRTPPNPSSEVDVSCGGAWAIGPPFATARRNFSTDTDVGQINFGTGHIWLAGGYANDGVTPLSSIEIYCYSVPTPSEPPPMTPTATPTATPTPTTSSPTPSATSMPCSVTSGICGTITSTQPTDFVMDVNGPVDPATVDATDFFVNGLPANSFMLSNGNTTIIFHFNSTPVNQELNVMHIPGGAFDCGIGPVVEFTCTFIYAQRNSPTPRPRPSPARRP